jgi:hypothetical protein
VEPALTAERSGPGPESRHTFFAKGSKRMSGIQKEKLLTNGHNDRLSVPSSPEERNEKSKESQKIRKDVGAYIFNALGKPSIDVADGFAQKTFSSDLVFKVQRWCVDK